MRRVNKWHLGRYWAPENISDSIWRERKLMQKALSKYIDVVTAQATFNPFSCNQENMVCAWGKEHSVFQYCLFQSPVLQLTDKDVLGCSLGLVHRCYWQNIYDLSLVSGSPASTHHSSFSALYSVYALQSATLTYKQLLYFAWESHFRCWESQCCHLNSSNRNF